MFVFQLQGGLGNQMFQYAAAKALTLARGGTFAIDFDDPYKFVRRELRLDVFNAKFRMADRKELNLLKPKRKIKKRIFTFLGKNPSQYLFKEEKDFHFQENFFLCPDPAYISGFWQSEKYFQFCKESIQSDFSFKNPPSFKNQEWLDLIYNTNAVSIHIRRGDYVNVARTNSLHGVLGLDYYMKAVDYVAQKLTNPTFFFFSDDIEWVKANFKIAHDSFYIDGNENAEHEDLRLMSHCMHNIIANSSFSWWGAWLNTNSDKIVIAPKEWMKNTAITIKDLIPETWIQM